MDFTFGELISHIAYNRNLRAGMILGSGTVSNVNWQEVGSACLAERRALDIIEHGEIKTDFLKFGESVRFEVFDEKGSSVFGGDRPQSGQVRITQLPVVNSISLQFSVRAVFAKDKNTGSYLKFSLQL